MKLFSSILAVLGTLAATFGTQGCTVLILDEPKMPKSLLIK